MEETAVLVAESAILLLKLDGLASVLDVLRVLHLDVVVAILVLQAEAAKE